MTKITIRPAWIFISETGQKVDPQLFVLLKAIHDNGKLTIAAKQAQLSYRYAWNLLGKWALFFNSPLVTMERGRGAQLTILGSKLLWAEQRSDASFFPQLENIASELNLEIAKAVKDAQSVIKIYCSHGYAVEKLPMLMRQHGNATLDIQYMDSVPALMSLIKNQCDLAGFHVPLGRIGQDLWQQYTKWLKPKRQNVIRLVIRTQGLIVARGNPLSIYSLKDLVRPEIRFVNRQRESGTRLLLDGLLKAQSIDSRLINGHHGGEFTHAAVAAFVASGMADAAFGVEPAARQFKLDFIPLIKERYMLAVNKNALKLTQIQELLNLLQSGEFEKIIKSIPGYEIDNPGNILDIDKVISLDN